MQLKKIKDLVTTPAYVVCTLKTGLDFANRETQQWKEFATQMYYRTYNFSVL